jgi:hypothetical protein
MENLKLINVQSSNIIAIGWQDNTLFVQYKSGTYAYDGVSKELYELLVAAESKGRWMNEQIKGKYTYKKL